MPKKRDKLDSAMSEFVNCVHKGMERTTVLTDEQRANLLKKVRDRHPRMTSALWTVSWADKAEFGTGACERITAVVSKVLNTDRLRAEVPSYMLPAILSLLANSFLADLRDQVARSDFREEDRLDDLNEGYVLPRHFDPKPLIANALESLVSKGIPRVIAKQIATRSVAAIRSLLPRIR
jgi:hypothetical protein